MRKIFLVILLLGPIMNICIAKPLADSRDVDLMAITGEERIRSIQIPPAKVTISNEEILSICFLKDINSADLIIKNTFTVLFESGTRSFNEGEIIDIDLNTFEPGVYTLWIEGGGESWYGQFEIE